MDFNFYEQYKNSSTVDLLLIVKQPGKYQPAAVDAAKMILSERNVSEAEEVQVVQAIAAQQSKVEKRDEDKTLSELLDPLTDSNANRHADRVMYIFLTIVSVYYCWEAYGYFKRVLMIFADERYLGAIFHNGVRFLLVSTMLYFLWKKHPWGWKLLLGLSFFFLTEEISFVYKLLSISIFAIEAIPLAIIISLVLKVIFIIYIWRNKIAHQFSVYRPDKWKTVKVTLIIFALLSLWDWIRYTDIKIIS